MKKLLVLGALAAMLASGTALADTSGKKIAFSNNYAGNSWRQAMLDSYGIVTKKAVDDKVVGAADIFTTTSFGAESRHGQSTTRKTSAGFPCVS